MFSRLLSPFKEFGPFDGLLYGIDRLLARLGSPLRLYAYDLMVQPIASQSRVPDSLKRNLVVREIGRDDPALAQMPLTEETLAFRLRQPVVCLGAFHKGVLIGYMWLCFGPYDEDEVRCTFETLPKNEAVWDFDVYVFPEHRIGIGFAGLWDGANAYLRARGICHSFSRVSRFNLTSRRVHRHFGATAVGRAWFLSGPRGQVTVTTVRPYLHIALSRGRRPVLRLQADRR